MFLITNLLWKPEQGKGFHITFPNGWTVSVQWGEGNYCDSTLEKNGHWKGQTAEVWAWPSDEERKNPYHVQGFLTPMEVLEFLNEIATIPE